MVTYKTYSELKGNTLNYGDKVLFKVKDRELYYRVYSDYLGTGDGSNAMIFTLLGLRKYEIAEEAYGYETSTGDWPVYYGEDYEAATRLALKILLLCHGEVDNWKQFLEDKK